MVNKTPYSIADQITLLKQRGMLFNDEQSAHHFLKNISYYRLKAIGGTCKMMPLRTPSSLIPILRTLLTDTTLIDA